MILVCESCKRAIEVPGLALEKAEEYINKFFQNTGYAYREI